MQVEPLHQDPVVVGGQKVDEEQHGHFTADLKTKTFTRLLKAVCLCVCVCRTAAGVNAVLGGCHGC